MNQITYKTQGVCSREIVIEEEGGLLKEVRFNGGGCPGQAELVTRLLKDRPMTEVLALAQGIKCRNETSCPDQLAQAIIHLQRGESIETPALSHRQVPGSFENIAVMARIDGRAELLKAGIQTAQKAGARQVLLLGNAIHPDGSPEENRRVLDLIEDEGVLAVRGPGDHRLAQGEGRLALRDRRWLQNLPVLISFYVGAELVCAFSEGYFLDWPEFSDRGPFALEVIGLADLSHCLADETVFPALTSLAREMSARMIICGRGPSFKQRRLGGKTFINLSPSAAEFRGRPGLNLVILTAGPRGPRIDRIKTRILSDDQ